MLFSLPASLLLALVSSVPTLAHQRSLPARINDGLQNANGTNYGFAGEARANIAARAFSTYSGPQKGDGTFYGNDGSEGNCLLPARSDLMFAAFPGSVYNNGAHCGSCVRVTGPKGSVNVQITNKCPECAPGSLDLSTAAFAKIANQSAGRVPISWTWVSCKDPSVGLETEPVSFVWKQGSSQYWSAIQVRHAALGVQSLAVLKDGSYVNLPRQDYNYFLASSGLGPGPYSVKVTLQDGSLTTYPGVKLNAVMGN